MLVSWRNSPGSQHPLIRSAGRGRVWFGGRFGDVDGGLEE